MEVDFEVQYTNRKTFGLVIDRDKSIFVKAPIGTSNEKISDFIDNKKQWIYQKLKNKQKYKNIPEKEFISGSSILYLGRNYNLDIDEYDHEGIKFDGRFLLSNNEKDNVNQLFRDWFIKKCEEKVISIADNHAKNLGVNYNKVFVKDLKFRWGSCTPRNNLSINWRLIKAPLSVINYVVIHELTHLIEANHTKRFWNIVKTQMPKYEDAINWLKDNGQILEISFINN